MLSVVGSPLVAGGTAAPMATKHIRVERAFIYNKQRLEVGAVLEVDARFAAEMVAANKAAICSPPAPPPVEPAPDEAVRPRPRRSFKNVG